MATSSSSVRDIMRIVFRRKWAWIVPIVLGVLAAEAVWLLEPYLQEWLPARYAAEAIVQRKDLAAMGGAPRSLISPASARATLEMIKQELLIHSALRAVITDVDRAKSERWKEAGYPANYPAERRPAGVDKWRDNDPRWQSLYDKVTGAVAITRMVQRQGIDLVRVRVQHSDPWEAAELANALADEYVETSKEALKADSQHNLGFYQKGRNEALAKVRDLEAQLDKYREDFFVDLPNVKLSTWGRLLDLRTEEDLCDGMLEQIDASEAEVDRQMTQTPQVVEEETSNRNPKAVALQEQINQQERLLAALLVNRTPEHPKVKHTREAIDSLKEELTSVEPMVPGQNVKKQNPTYEKLRQEKQNLGRQRQAQKAAKLRAQQRIQATYKQLQDIGAKEMTYYDLQRELREATELYENYRKQLVGAQTRADAEDTETGTQVEKVQPAVEPAFAIRQPYKKWIAMLIMGSFACAVGLVFGLEFLDHTLRNREDAEGLLKEMGVPVLASIPTIMPPEAEARKRRARRLGVISALAIVLIAASLAAGKLKVPEKIGSGVQRAVQWLKPPTQVGLDVRDNSRMAKQ